MLLNVSSFFTFMRAGGFISLCLHKSFFFSYFSKLDFFNELKLKLASNFFKSKEGATNFYKQLSNYYSSKYINFLNLNTEVPLFLEVDFFTLSVFVFNFFFLFKFYSQVFSFFFLRSLN